ncbi:MAG: peptidylprolyl isomerase, partial [Mycobacteriales bacterium]
MPSTKRQRELARRRAERQAARRAEMRQRRRSRRLTVAGVSAAVLLIVGGAFALTKVVGGKDKVTTPPTASPSASAAATKPACGATAPAPAKKQTFAKAPKLTIDTKKTYTATLKTSCALVSFDMLAAKAPQTVNSFVFLAGKHYFDGTFCHRMTTSGIFVLQCG